MGNKPRNAGQNKVNELTEENQILKDELSNLRESVEEMR